MLDSIMKSLEAAKKKQRVPSRTWSSEEISDEERDSSGLIPSYKILYLTIINFVIIGDWKRKIQISYFSPKTNCLTS